MKTEEGGGDLRLTHKATNTAKWREKNKQKQKLNSSVYSQKSRPVPDQLEAGGGALWALTHIILNVPSGSHCGALVWEPHLIKSRRRRRKRRGQRSC